MISFKYTKDFQVKLLVNLLRNEKFFLDTVNHIRVSDFDLPVCRLIFEIAKIYYKKYNKLIPLSIMEIEIQRAINTASEYTTIIQPEEFEALATAMEQIYTTPQDQLTPEYFRGELKGYLSYVRTHQAQEKYASSADQFIAEAVKINEELAKAENSGKIKFVYATDKVEPVDISNRIGTGLYTIDKFINHGLTRKQTGVIIACTGVGKTTAMINFAVNNALKDIRSLFITLELPSEVIRQRYQGIIMNINASWFSKPKSTWTEDVLWRMNYVESPEFKFSKHVAIADFSTENVPVSTIDTAVGQWKEHMINEGASENSCAVVYVDWLERIDKSGLPNTTKTTSDPALLAKIQDELGRIARKYDVVVWSATQASTDAIGREVLSLKHTANSKHINDTTDLSIGIAPIIPEAVTDETYETDRPVNSDCSRQMMATFLKTRYASSAGKTTVFYQGPTLRFWNKEEDAARAAIYASQKNLDALYKMMGFQIKV